MAYIPNENRYSQMEYRRCGNSGLKLPLLSLGLWHNFGDTNSLERMAQLCETAFDGGITHFDLANNYGPPAGAAERNFGRLLKTIFAGHRDELVISTKAGYDMWDGPYGDGGSRKYLLASLDQSLKRLGVDYLLPPSPRPGNASGGDHGRTGAGGAERQGAVCGAVQL